MKLRAGRHTRSRIWSRARSAARPRVRRGVGEALAGRAWGAAGVAQRLGSLLRGGVPPARALELLALEATGGAALNDAASGGAAPGGAALNSTARGGVPPPEVGRVLRGLAEGLPAAEALAEGGSPAWRLLAVAWRLAETSGAPLAPALERIGAALRELERLEQRRAVLLAGPRATIRLVTALPPLALLLGAALGFDPLPVLLSPVGLMLITAGGALLAAGAAWGRRLQRSVGERDCVAGTELELLWITLGGGAPFVEARRRVIDGVDEFGAEWVPFARFTADGLLANTVAAARGTGSPLAPMLIEEAAAARRGAHAELESEAERLGVRVLLPLGLCVLPSFIVLGVVPVVISMLGGV